MIEPLVFCLDFDGTFTADVELWSSWVEMAQLRGHRVVCITGRRETDEGRRELKNALPDGVDIYFADDMPKMDYASKVGVTVDVWIDDWPGLITGR